MSESDNHDHHHGPVFETSHAEGRMNWVFYDFWPVMIWVAVFCTMCALPIILSGMLHSPFSSADIIWWGYGLLVLALMFMALVIFIVAPRFASPYVLLVSIYYLIAADHGKAWEVTGMPWGSSIAILVLTYVLVGNLIFLKAGLPEKKKKQRQRL